MARIPLGDFGNVVARPAPRAQVDPQAYGAGVGQALDQSGQIGMRIAGQEIAQNNAELAQGKREYEAEIRRLAHEQAAEAKAIAREASRVKSLTASASITNGLNDLHDEIANGLADGSVDKTKAVETFATKAAKLQSSGLEGVDAEHRPLVEASLLDNVGRARRSVAGLVTQRDKSDIKAGGLAYFEEMQRFAARGTKEADQAIANVRTFWSATGPMAGEDPATASARVQKFAEGVRFNQASSLVNTDPGAALKALKNNKYLPELDPGARTNLIHTADSRVTQAANRADIAARANERKMESEWKAISTVFDAGKVLDNASAEHARQVFKGSPYGAALEQMMRASPGVTAFASQPIQAQSQALMDMQARLNKGGASPADIETYKKAETAHQAALSDINRDPYQAAAERGVITGIAPLSIDMKQLPAQLAQRAQDAQRVGVWVGQDVSLFREAEANKVGDVLKALPPKDQAGAMAALSKAMTPGQATAFAKQLEPQSKPMAMAFSLALNMGQSQTTNNRFTSELLLLGQQAIKDKSIKPDNAAITGAKAQAASYLGNALTGKARDDVLEAATMISYGMQAEGQGADMERAVRLAVGGNIIERTGRKIPVPAGFEKDTFERAIGAAALNAVGDKPVIVGGRAMPSTEFLKGLPAAGLEPVGHGRYVVRAGSGLVTMDGRRPLVLEVGGVPP